MTDFRIDNSARSIRYTDEEIATVVDVMKNADPLTQGKYQEEFEKKLAEYIGVEHAFAVSNCTSALELAATFCNLSPRDEVIVPAHTFAATVIPFLRTGAKIVWADIDPLTWCVSADTIKPHINARTKVIVPVHLYGLPAQMPEIMELADKHNILVVEDCAQSIGSAIGKKKTGSFGDFACFSFHQHKNITTLGEGGALIVRDERIAREVPGMRHNGIRPFATQADYWNPAMSNVVNPMYPNALPYNYCMSEVQCALGTKLLERVDAINKVKNVMAKNFMRDLMNYRELQFQKFPDDYYHNRHLMPAKYNGRMGARSYDLIRLMAFTYGIKCVVQYRPLYRYPLFEDYGFKHVRCKNSEAVFDNMVSFPFHHWMSSEDLTYMIESTQKALETMRGWSNFKR
jgi:perosamine synthetase